VISGRENHFYPPIPIKQLMKNLTRLAKSSFVTVAASLGLLTASAPAAIVSVNLTPYTTDAANIDSDEVFGITNLNTVVGGWVNFNRNGGDNAQGTLTTSALPFSDASASTLTLSLTAPNSWASGFNGAYADTPLNQGLDDYPTTASPTSLTLSNLNANFPNGYKVIVYFGGFLSQTNASISDGTTTFYYRAANTAAAASNAVASGFSRTTQTSNLGGGNNPVAQYAVFGDPTLLTNDVKTFTLDCLIGGGAGLCGFQVVGQSATELTARIWKGNINSSWETAALNWTNVIFGATNYADGDQVFFTDAAVDANPTVNLTAPRSPVSVTVDSTKNYTLTGSGITGATGLTKKNSGTLTLANPNTYSGNTAINAGTLKIGASGALPDGAGAGNVSVAAGATLDLNGFSEGINGLSGSGTVDNTAGAATLTIGLNNNGGTFAGTLQGAVGLTKQGTNTVTFTGNSFHTGPTIVAQGGLVLNPLSSFSSSSVLVVSNGANLQVSFTNGSGLFTTANLSFNGGTALTVDYGNANFTAFGTPLSTSGTLNLNGVTQIGIQGLNFGVGTFTIISYSSKTGSGSISSTPAFLPSGMVATIQDTGSAINLVVTTPSVQALLWTQGDGEWSTNGYYYWNLGTATYTEYPSGFGDSVSFDNSNFGTVTLPHDVHPFSVTVAGNYVLTGPGRITGNTGLNRSGFSGTTFVLDNANTYTGVTTVSAGTLQVNQAGALGSAVAGTVVASGASLALSNGVTLANEPITLNGNGTASNNGALRTVDTNSLITLASPITLGSTARIRVADGGQLNLTAPVTDSGSNYTLFLHADQTNSLIRINTVSNHVGGVTLYANNTTRGLIRFEVNHAFPESLVNIGGGLIDLNGTDQVVAGLGNGFNPNLGVLTNSSATASTVTINYSGTNSAQLLSALAGRVNIVKTGTGVQSFGGGSIVHTYSGTTTINGGILGLASDLSQVTNSFTVNSGGTLRGEATVGGPVTVNLGGTFYAGFASNDIGTLTINNSLTLAGNTILALNKDLVQSNDVVNVSGALTYGGTLTVYNLGSNALAVGDTFTVFPPGGSGNFSSIVSDPDVTFSFNNGVLTVTSAGVTPTTLNYTSPAAGVLQFNWSGPFKLQYQTNSAAVGLGANWQDYPDLSNPVNVTNNPAVPATFFRLKSL
jgi:autotransporter-associated beta strand protein